jgi:hypothetical protein
MEVQVNGIGDFDVRFTGLSLDELRAGMEDAKAPKIRNAFKAAIDGAEARASGRFIVTVVTPGEVLECCYGGKRVATLRRYAREGRVFWQAYHKGENIRRKTSSELADAIANRVVAINAEDLL